MKKFMILYMAPISAEEQMNVSPEEMKKGMEPWIVWIKKMGKALDEGGTPLVNGIHFTKNRESKGKTEVTGFNILRAKDMDEVKMMLTDHPHFIVPEASIEVFEMMPMM
jgi:hypothetical protein